jgi:AcrR family transcriptional regulator
MAAATEILYEGGIEALSTRAIAERSGIPVATIYRCFENSDALIAAFRDREMEKLDETVTAAVLALERVTLRSLIEAATLAHFHHHRRHPQTVMVWFGARQSPAVRDRVKRWSRRSGVVSPASRSVMVASHMRHSTPRRRPVQRDEIRAARRSCPDKRLSDAYRDERSGVGDSCHVVQVARGPCGPRKPSESRSPINFSQVSQSDILPSALFSFLTSSLQALGTGSISNASVRSAGLYLLSGYFLPFGPALAGKNPRGSGSRRGHATPRNDAAVTSCADRATHSPRARRVPGRAPHWRCRAL